MRNGVLGEADGPSNQSPISSTSAPDIGLRSSSNLDPHDYQYRNTSAPGLVTRGITIILYLHRLIAVNRQNPVPSILYLPPSSVRINESIPLANFRQWCVETNPPPYISSRYFQRISPYEADINHMLPDTKSSTRLITSESDTPQ